MSTPTYRPAGSAEHPCHAPGWSYLEGVPGGRGLFLERGQEESQVSVAFERLTVPTARIRPTTGSRAE